MSPREELAMLEELTALDAKAGPSTDHIGDAIKYGPGFLKEAGKGLLRGAGQTISGYGDIMRGLAGKSPLGMMMAPMALTAPVGKTLGEMLPNDLPDTGAGKVFNRAMEGTGAVAAAPLPGVGPVVQATQGAAMGMAGEGARQQAERAFPNSPTLQAGADMAGSIFGGALPGFMLGPKQTVGQQDIRRAAAGTTPEQFARAKQNSQQARDVGARTATGAEMFEPGSGIMALADKTRGSNPDNALRQLTVERPSDIQNIANEFLNRIQTREVNPNSVATQAASSADSFFKNLKHNRGADTRAPMAGVSLPSKEVEGLAQGMRQLSGFQERLPAQNAYMAVGDAIAPNASPLRPNGIPITTLQELSFAVKDLKKSMKNPNSPVSTGQIGAMDFRNATGQVEDYLSTRHPPYRDAMDAFGAHTEQLLKPAGQSPIGKLSNRNPILAGEQSVSKLEGLTKGNNPTMIGDAVTDLANPKLTLGNPTNPLDIARALAQNRLKDGPPNPGAAMRGTEGSADQQAFEALLKAGGRDPGHTMAPLAVADRLQPFAGPSGISELPRMTPWQMAIRPLRTLDMMTTGHTARNVNQEVARLLADNSPGAIQRLQEIAMFDPNVRRMLTAKSLIPTTGQEQ
jgi:hypothetical protein